MLTASASGLYLFGAQCPTPPILYLRFTASLAVAAQDSRPSGSLLLSCKALSSSTFMPVYPGALTSGFHSLTFPGPVPAQPDITLNSLDFFCIPLRPRMRPGADFPWRVLAKKC